MVATSLCSSTLQSQVNGLGGGLKLQKSSLFQPRLVTFYRRKLTTTVKATSHVNKFSKTNVIVAPSILFANFAKLGEQSFIERQVKTISDLRRLYAEKGVNLWIEVDGGVGPANMYKVIKAGVNALVVGFVVFGAKDYAESIKGIKTSRKPEPVTV